MPHRQIRAAEPAVVRTPLTIAHAMRETFRHGYTRRDAFADLQAGVVVGVVAIPLSMALAIATGMPPQHGLYTAIVAGIVCALLGGSKVQITGPTAAFVVILAPIAGQYGPAGLLIASMMAGLLLLCMAVGRMGRLIEFVPYPVTAGFTAGIAVVIATLEVQDFLGLTIVKMPQAFLGKVGAIVQALPTAHASESLIGLATLLAIIYFPKLTTRVPAPVAILPLVAGIVYVCTETIPGFDVATINSRFSYMVDGAAQAGIPRMLPPIHLPWNWAGPEGAPLILSLELIRALLPAAFAIAMLAAIESLLSAVIADGMTRSKHNPDAELFAIGAANVVAPFFGGFAATGAIARTATNIRLGAKSPFAAITHSAVIVLAIVTMAPLLGYLPMAALAALLLRVAWTMSEARHVLYVVRIAPKSDAFVLISCFALTVVFDMVVAVTAGMILASLLFIRRMAEASTVKLLRYDSAGNGYHLPDTVLVYEIRGPLFFGAAEKAMAQLHIVGSDVRVILLDLRMVLIIDVTGLINLESAIERLHRTGIRVVVGGLSSQVQKALRKANWQDDGDKLLIRPDWTDALAAAAETEAADPPLTAAPVLS